MYRSFQTTKKDSARLFFDKVLESIPKTLRDSDPIIMFPGGGLGELTYCLSLAPHLKQNHPLAIAIKSESVWLSKFFPNSYDFIVSYNNLSFGDLVTELFEISAPRPGYPLVIRPDLIGDGHFCTKLVVQESRLTFAEAHAYNMGLPLTSKLTYPVLPLTLYKNKEQRSVETRTCLILHHARTMPTLPVKFWEELVTKLKSMEIRSLFDETQGKISSEFTYLQLNEDKIVTTLTDFDIIICLRSGLSDIFASMVNLSRNKLIVLYNTLSDYQRYETGICKPGVSKSGISLKKIWNSNFIFDIEVTEKYEFVIDEIITAIYS